MYCLTRVAFPTNGPRPPEFGGHVAAGVTPHACILSLDDSPFRSETASNNPTLPSSPSVTARSTEDGVKSSRAWVCQIISQCLITEDPLLALLGMHLSVEPRPRLSCKRRNEGTTGAMSVEACLWLLINRKFHVPGVHYGSGG